MIELLTFKLIIDLFDELRVYNMEIKEVQIFLWKKQTRQYQYFTFDSYEALYDFYVNRYAPFDLYRVFGDIWGVNWFTVTSDLDPTYTMSFGAYDVSDNYYIRDISQFDNQRNSVWSSSKERQIGYLDDTVSRYGVYWRELYDIYLSGIYSVCYAEPGWTTHITILQSYREMLFPVNPVEVDDRYASIVFTPNQA